MNYELPNEIFNLLVVFGGFSALFLGLGILSDYVIPYLAERFGWEIS